MMEEVPRYLCVVFEGVVVGCLEGAVHIKALLVFLGRVLPIAVHSHNVLKHLLVLYVD